MKPHVALTGLVVSLCLALGVSAAQQTGAATKDRRFGPPPHATWEPHHTSETEGKRK